MAHTLNMLKWPAGDLQNKIKKDQLVICESNYCHSTLTGPPDSIGISIYRDTRKLGFIVNDGTTEWSEEVTDAVPANLWKNIALAWSATTGMSVKKYK